MSKFESKAAVTVNEFNGSAERPATADKNGEMPVILRVVAGKLPNRALVLSGTVAKRAGLRVGQPALVQCTEGDTDEQYGRQFNVNKIADLSAFEIMQAEGHLGKPQVIDVDVTQKEEIEA